MSRNENTKGGREAWIDAGWRALASEGPAGVRVEALARTLGLTKGSFYHHFAGRDALLEALLAEWRQVATEEVVARVGGAGAPLAQLRELVHEALAPSPVEGLEAGIRAWATSDARARAVVERVDQRRIEFVVQLLRAAGLARAEARLRAQVLYRLIIGDYTWRDLGGKAFSRRERARVFALLVADLEVGG